MKAKFINTKDIIKKQQGFTLIELLVVIGILAILLAIVLIAINPARQFAQANNTKRRSDVSAILNAIGAYGADNHGNLSVLVLDNTDKDAGSTTTICHSILGTADSGNSSGPSYISALPTDPSLNKADITNCEAVPAPTAGYTVTVDAAGRVTVKAPSAELGEIIQATR